jgi:tetratricopeptide (TPR) repeat protein
VSLGAGRVTTVTPKRVPTTDAGELALQRADDLVANGRSAEAVDAYHDAITARGGRFAAAQIGLARVLLAGRKTEEAMAAVNAALDEAPKSVEANTVLGNVLRERGLYDEAMAAYRKAIALSPDHAPEAHTGLAIVLDEHGDREQSVAEFRTAIAQNQDAEPLLYQLLGGVLEHLDRREEAAEAYERFLALAPNHSLAPAVRSLLDQLRQPNPAEEDGDVNPYAPKRP